MKFGQILLVLMLSFAVLASLTAGVWAFSYSSTPAAKASCCPGDCCAPGAPCCTGECCVPGAPCCEAGAPCCTASCCAAGAPCCEAGAACCAK